MSFRELVKKMSDRELHELTLSLVYEDTYGGYEGIQMIDEMEKKYGVTLAS